MPEMKAGSSSPDRTLISLAEDFPEIKVKMRWPGWLQLKLLQLNRVAPIGIELVAGMKDWLGKIG